MMMMMMKSMMVKNVPILLIWQQLYFVRTFGVGFSNAEFSWDQMNLAAVLTDPSLITHVFTS